MSKDKGVKNIKKAPADKTKGLGKTPSAYKAEGKSGYAIMPKPDTKAGNSPKLT
jgi:hypothetical protein